MDHSLRRKLLKLARENEAAARQSLEASEGVESVRGRFLFELYLQEWLPEFFDARQVMARHSAILSHIIDEHGCA